MQWTLRPIPTNLLGEEMARRGFLVFADQGVLSGDEQAAPDSKLLGGSLTVSFRGS